MRALKVLVLVPALSLLGCGGEECRPAPASTAAPVPAEIALPRSPVGGRLLWSRDGCAFYVQPNFGSNVYLRRVPDADRTPCAAPRGHH